VEGVGHLCGDVREHTIQVFHHVSRGDAKNAIALSSHVTITSIVPLRPIAEIMTPAVDFDHEPRSGNVEIRRV
jgi:hypothetical protein